MKNRYSLIFSLLVAMLFKGPVLYAQHHPVEQDIEFDHLYTVIPDSTYRKILSHPFIREHFANIDKGRPAFDAIDTAKKEAYFRFMGSYFELLSTANKWKEPRDKLGLGWVNNRTGNQPAIERLLKEAYGEAATYVPERDSVGRELFDTYYIKPSDSTIYAPLDYWIYDYKPFFIEYIYGSQQTPVDITGKTYRVKHYAADKLAHDLTEIGLLLTPREAKPLMNWLRTIGYTLINNDNNITLSKGKLVFVLCLNDKLNKLSYLKFSHNNRAKPSVLRFSSSCVLKISEKASIWCF